MNAVLDAPLVEALALSACAPALAPRQCEAPGVRHVRDVMSAVLARHGLMAPEAPSAEPVAGVLGGRGVRARAARRAGPRPPGEKKRPRRARESATGLKVSRSVVSPGREAGVRGAS